MPSCTILRSISRTSVRPVFSTTRQSAIAAPPAREEARAVRSGVDPAHREPRRRSEILPPCAAAGKGREGSEMVHRRTIRKPGKSPFLRRRTSWTPARPADRGSDRGPERSSPEPGKGSEPAAAMGTPCGRRREIRELGQRLCSRHRAITRCRRDAAAVPSGTGSARAMWCAALIRKRTPTRSQRPKRL